MPKKQIVSFGLKVLCVFFYATLQCNFIYFENNANNKSYRCFNLLDNSNDYYLSIEDHNEEEDSLHQPIERQKALH